MNGDLGQSRAELMLFYFHFMFLDVAEFCPFLYRCF